MVPGLCNIVISTLVDCNCCLREVVVLTTALVVLTTALVILTASLVILCNTCSVACTGLVWPRKVMWWPSALGNSKKRPNTKMPRMWPHPKNIGSWPHLGFLRSDFLICVPDPGGLVGLYAFLGAYFAFLGRWPQNGLGLKIDICLWQKKSSLCKNILLVSGFQNL